MLKRLRQGAENVVTFSSMLQQLKEPSIKKNNVVTSQILSRHDLRQMTEKLS